MSTTVPRIGSVDIRWPNARQMFEGALPMDWSRRLKYLLRCALTLRARAAVLHHVRQCHFAELLFTRQPRAFYPVMNTLLDRRLGQRDRVRVMRCNLSEITRRLPSELAEALACGERLCLATLPDGTALQLGINEISYHEGLLALYLRRPDGTRLYTVTFGFTDARTLLIGSVQGPALGEQGAQVVRDLTSTAHGLRPHFLLMQALRQICQRWDIQTLLGIDPVHHVKGRWNHRGARLKFDYRAFWLELGAEQRADGHWSLPVQVAERPLDEVPSKRRAMYRRRYEMLAGVQASLDQALGVTTPAGRADPAESL